MADDRAQIVDQASDAAGWAFRGGDYAKASRLTVARTADPSLASLWAERSARVHAAAREQAAKVGGPDDVRPLGKIVAARLEAAGIGAGDPAVQFARAWNAERMAAAAEREAEDTPTAGQEQETLDSLAELEAGS